MKGTTIEISVEEMLELMKTKVLVDQISGYIASEDAKEAGYASVDVIRAMLGVAPAAKRQLTTII